jgi:DNA invertase Pin-like site-specific DNA recombinase
LTNSISIVVTYNKLVELVGHLIERKVGLLRLNDTIDTTSAQGHLDFNLFASLAKFEPELIRERTQAGLVGITKACHRRLRNSHGRRNTVS